MGLDKSGRDFLLGQGICPQCQKRAIEPNKHACYECLGRARDRYHQRKADGSLKKKQIRANERKMSEYYSRKEKGICVKCGKCEAQHGVLCNRCYTVRRSKQISKQDDIQRSERPDYGRCYICGAEGLYDGHNVCKDCYETRMKTIPIMLANMNNSYFRSQNDLEFAMRNSKQ